MSLSPRLGSQVEAPPPPAPIRFECTCKLDAWGWASLELIGELDRAVCGELKSRLAEALRASDVVTLDMRRLTFMDSAGCAVLVSAARSSSPGGRLILTGCGGQVSRLLSVVGLPAVVEIQRDPRPSVLRGDGASAATGLGQEAPLGA